MAADHKCNALVYEGKGTPLVFLHGFSYNAEIWRIIGVTSLLEEKRIPYLAMDMPYGPKAECKPKTRRVDANVAVVREAVVTVFGSNLPLLVGASFGGHIALMYAAQFPVRGLLLISPTRVFYEALIQAYPKFTFPVRLIWGSEDTIVSGEDLRNLIIKLPNAKLVTYEEAGHSSYRSQPERFKRDLLELYAETEET